MKIYFNQFEKYAKSYVQSLTGSITCKDNRIISELINRLKKEEKLEILKTDFTLLLNQLYYINHFGPFSKIELFLTENCNLNCSYCFVKKKQNRAMRIETAKDAINFLVFYSGPVKNLSVTFFGGEPLLEFDLICEVIKYCNSIEHITKFKKINFAITTNGTLINEDVMKRLNGKVNLLLSLDGDKETHDKYRIDNSGSGSYERIISNIDIIKKYQPWLGTRMTVLPTTVNKLFENVLHLYDLGINQFLIGLSIEDEWDSNKLKIYENELKKIGSFYLKKKHYRKPFRMTFFEDNINKNNHYQNRWGCRAGKSSITVDINGNIFPCSKFIGLEKYNCPELKLGTIYEGITNIKLSNNMNKMTNENYVNCLNCKEKDCCSGGCPADNYFENRNIYLPCKNGCKITTIHNRILRNFWKRNEKVLV
ncbi:MAG: radical SAM protein [Bacteroidales bacterium]|nr:radical SAM protein [Bacteroidales bacterium]